MLMVASVDKNREDEIDNDTSYHFFKWLSKWNRVFSTSKVLFDLEKIATETFVIFFYNIDEM